jgi:hypothetical protein
LNSLATDEDKLNDLLITVRGYLNYVEYGEVEKTEDKKPDSNATSENYSREENAGTT